MPVGRRYLIALICAVLAFALMVAYTAQVRASATNARSDALERYGGEVVQVCVTTRDVVEGEVFGERNVAIRSWLVDLLPEGALMDPASVMGSEAASSMARNTVIASVDVRGADNTLQVPQGLVALAIPVNDQSAVGGALGPGDTVDIYMVAEGNARLLQQGVTLLRTNAAGTGAALSWATVAVDAGEAQALIAAGATHRLYLVLPSEGELEARATSSVDPVEVAGYPGGTGQPDGTGQADGSAPTDAAVMEGQVDGQDAAGIDPTRSLPDPEPGR